MVRRRRHRRGARADESGDALSIEIVRPGKGQDIGLAAHESRHLLQRRFNRNVAIVVGRRYLFAIEENELGAVAARKRRTHWN
jgi:hypothetical protein